MRELVNSLKGLVVFPGGAGRESKQAHLICPRTQITFRMSVKMTACTILEAGECSVCCQEKLCVRKVTVLPLNT